MAEYNHSKHKEITSLGYVMVFLDEQRCKFNHRYTEEHIMEKVPE